MGCVRGRVREEGAVGGKAKGNEPGGDEGRAKGRARGRSAGKPGGNKGKTNIFFLFPSSSILCILVLFRLPCHIQCGLSCSSRDD